MRTFIGFDEHCTYTREDAITCFSKYVDTNKDGVISKEEIDDVQKKDLTWGIKLIKWATGYTPETSTAIVMRDCDYNKDGVVTADDFRRASITCMPSQWALCAVKMVCDHAKDGDPTIAKPPRKSWFSWST